MSWLILAGIGAVVGLDSTSFPQVMLSRPIVAGTLTGLVFGRPLEGALLGAVMELFDLSSLPIGAARYPEAGTATVGGAGALMLAEAAPGYTAFVLISLFTLVWERVAGATVVAARQLSEHIVGNGQSSARALELRHVTAMAVDLVRGAIVSVIGAGVALALVAAWPQTDPVVAESALRVLLVGGAAVLGAALAVFGGWSERRWVFLAGLVCGTLLLALA